MMLHQQMVATGNWLLHNPGTLPLAGMVVYFVLRILRKRTKILNWRTGATAEVSS
jgi:hypothetical protein